MEIIVDIGLSSACFYPLETEKSIIRAGETGAKTIEIFMNADSEFEPAFVKNMADMCNSYGMRVASVHTMGSFTESYHLFSSYKRRFFEAKDSSFKRHFDVMHTLGAEFLVLHGIKKPGSIPDEEYFDRFGELTLMGKAEGLKVCQENVVHYRSESPDFLLRMGEYIGDDFNMVFDIKQSIRTGINPFEYAEKLHKYIKHIHISDHNDVSDCFVPCKNGTFDFKRFFDMMKSYGYSGDFIIELYENGFESDKELTFAIEELKKLL